MGKMLTGCKDYAELIELASKGSARSLTQMMDEFPSLDQGDIKVDKKVEEYKSNEQVMKVMNDTDYPHLALPFNKVINDGIEKPAKEDVAFTLLQVMCQDLVSFCVSTARRAGIRKVYLCGSFCRDNPALLQHIKRMEMTENFMDGPLMTIHVLKHEGYIGAIGCFLLAAQKATEAK